MPFLNIVLACLPVLVVLGAICMMLEHKSNRKLTAECRAAERREMDNFDDLFSRAMLGEQDALRHLSLTPELLTRFSDRYDHSEWERILARYRIDAEYGRWIGHIQQQYALFVSGEGEYPQFENRVRAGAATLFGLRRLGEVNLERLRYEVGIDAEAFEQDLTTLIQDYPASLLEKASDSAEAVREFILWWEESQKWLLTDPDNPRFSPKVLDRTEYMVELPGNWNSLVAQHIHNPVLGDFLGELPPQAIPTGDLRLRAAAALSNRDWVDALVVLAYVNNSDANDRHRMQSLEVGDLRGNLALLVARSRARESRVTP